jgi:hypothetical protein
LDGIVQADLPKLAGLWQGFYNLLRVTDCGADHTRRRFQSLFAGRPAGGQAGCSVLVLGARGARL